MTACRLANIDAEPFYKPGLRAHICEAEVVVWLDDVGGVTIRQLR